jgi:hypothetical protein
LLAADFLGA